ncbi:TRAP transporter substrate-binding protein DctP [Seohaeicola nanhaiensis]|uniref:TRAP transporter substrate-binding protein DctP n=1 Tax=Seohaeicola nanhaiensis TaxID=1387282 RepID=A0ABV9KLE6_9RHOB
MTIVTRTTLCTTILAGSLLNPLLASAQDYDPVTLKLADSFPTTHVISVEGAQFFIDEVKKRSDGKISIEYFPASQLGKAGDFLALLQSGLVDIAYVPPAYVSEKMPLSDVGSLPGLFSDVCAGSRAFTKLAASGPVAENDFEGQGIKSLFATPLPPYQISGPKVPIKSLDDLEGRKIRSTGAATNLVVEALGGVPVNISGAETYEALDRGTIDFNLGPYSSYKGYDLYDQTKYGTVGFGFANIIVTYSISAETWGNLPEAAQTVLSEAGAATAEHLCGALESENDKAIQEMTDLGSEFYRATPEDLAKFAETAKTLQTNWAKALDARSFKGTETLEAMKAALAN